MSDVIACPDPTCRAPAERLTQPHTVDGVVARRMGRPLLDAVLGTTQRFASTDGKQQDRRIR
jgi:hypothetical protein